MPLNNHANYRCSACRRRLEAASTVCTCKDWDIDFVDGYQIRMYASRTLWRKSMAHYMYRLKKNNKKAVVV